ncbi:MAG TPA: DUF6252 family protein [Chitinophagaceae bacterium]|nr:DUF6252 family protein [Chitinophagaceae bacterium]
MVKIESLSTPFYIIFLVLLFSHCSKDNSNENLASYYKASINGKTKNVYACGTSGYIAEYVKDTAIFIGFGCGGERAGFYIKGKINDGTYALDFNNSAYYGLGNANYQTDRRHNGSITIESIQHKNAIGNTLSFIKGTFSFIAIDTTTGQTVTVKNGKYLFEKRQY